MYGGNIIKVVTLVILESSAPAEEVMLHYGYSFRCINLQGLVRGKLRFESTNCVAQRHETRSRPYSEHDLKRFLSPAAATARGSASPQSKGMNFRQSVHTRPRSVATPIANMKIWLKGQAVSAI